MKLRYTANGRIAGIAAAIGLLAGCALQAQQVTLLGNCAATGSLSLASSPVVSPSGGSGSPTNLWVYAFTGPFVMGTNQLTSAGVPANNRYTESFTLNLGGYSLTGSSGATNLQTYGGWIINNPYAGAAITAGTIRIVNVGSVSLGGVDTHAAADGTGGSSWGGGIGIGEPIGVGNGPAGSLSVDFLNASFVDVYHYTGYGNGGSITIYSTGNVAVAGNEAATACISGNGGGGGDITNLHRGSFSAVNVLTWLTNSAGTAECAGRITLDGSYGGVAPSGAFQARTINAAYYRTGYGGTSTRRAGGDVTIRGYTGVRLTGDLVTLDNSAGSSSGNLGAGNITITNINGDIQIDGTINAKSGTSSNYNGVVTMAATGKIFLASLNMTQVGSNTVLAATGKTYIAGAFLNFATANPANGWLNATNGLTIGYNAALATNAYLNSATYTLKGGGQVVPMPAFDLSPGVSNVTVTTADLNGVLGTSAAPAAVTVYWGTNSSAWSFSTNLGVCSPGLITAHVTGLWTNTTYYYAFQATNSDFPAGPTFVAAPFMTQIDVSSWTRRMKVGLTGYTRGETLVNFPLCVVLSSSLSGFQYSSFSATNGCDLRFYNAALTKELNYEIDGSWNPSGNTYVWVQVDQFATTNDYILAYWKNPAATNAAPAYTTNGATWATNYVGVWHMNQTNALDSS